MFDQISPRYDLLNRLLSLGIDQGWRRKAIATLKAEKPKLILDVATGTGDFAIAALKLNPQKVIGVDISEGMLAHGRQKLRKRQLDHLIELQSGDSENLNFPDNYFDAVIVSFGVRNFENLEKGLANIHRVLKPGGRLVVLEFSKPRVFPFRQIYHFYFHKILPKIGKAVSQDQSAYAYLPASVQVFPDGPEFLKIL
ncbi:MAG: bifunctional demethylmenaquinone methyltransferase/2-methoxy-6-polyprenyl-1,4-benzoquinol methylase UbiE, partial [Bacteroidia bacterium]|nr:bifunctional demethylmenaquinone methyltransferase/2-methoxy-6-polyprenyl-1,4-benzoquinol methylase UbiE [Bacteroidia bacterium]